MMLLVALNTITPNPQMSNSSWRVLQIKIKVAIIKTVIAKINPDNIPYEVMSGDVFHLTNQQRAYNILWYQNP
jgi:hypothetical protein